MPKQKLRIEKIGEKRKKENSTKLMGRGGSGVVEYHGSSFNPRRFITLTINFVEYSGRKEGKSPIYFGRVRNA